MDQTDDTTTKGLRQLAETPDLVERAKTAGELLSQHQTTVSELSRIRREAIEELLRLGKTQSEVADLLQMSRGRISQLTSSGPPPERAFLGTGALTVAMGGKLEAAKENPGPAVAKEALGAYDQLRKLAEGMRLEASYEVIPPPGNVRLNRDNLIVICGPRLSPLVGQVLEADRNLGFVLTEGRWELWNHRTGDHFVSPMDGDENGDVGYLGRLPRPDGRGSFLYLAGIHAVGTYGVACHLAAHLPELYAEVRGRRFSTLIACTYDPETREILTTKRVAPLYRPE